MKELICLISFLFSLIGSYCQNPDLSGMKKYVTQINLEKEDNQREEIKRSDTCSVSIGFYQDFSDTLDLYLNNMLLMHKYLYHDSDLVSTDFTGVDFNFDYSNNKEDIISIRYKNKGRYVQFSLDKRYPYYTIHAFNDICYVSGRKYVVVIK